MDILKELANPVSRRKAIKTITACAAGAAAFNLPEFLLSAPQKAASRPNMIFILGDNHNANDMAFMGHPFIKTPGMDRLAREGVTFRNTFNTTSLCSPSRASILTGAYVHNHGVLNNHTPWTDQMPVFLEHLSRSGYATSFIGKWHMPGHGLPEMPFLDLFVSYTYREGQGAYFNCPLIVNGREESSRKEYVTEEVTDRTIEFIEKERASENPRPFCIYLSHRPAHPPFKAPPDFSGMYDGEKVELPKGVNNAWFGKRNFNVFQGVMMGSYEDQYRKYCETITAMDRDILRLLDKLDDMGLSENTVVIYMADNGMQWGTHGRHGIREPYEDSAKLPLIIRAPGMRYSPGSALSQMALNIDIAPTLLNMAGAAVPAEMDGLSLAPLLGAAGSTQWRKSFLLEFWRYFPENTPSYIGVRTDAHKYVQFEKGRKPWLFDLAKDPAENHNLYGNPAHDALLADMKKQLLALAAAPARYGYPIIIG